MASRKKQPKKRDYDEIVAGIRDINDMDSLNDEEIEAMRQYVQAIYDDSYEGLMAPRHRGDRTMLEANLSAKQNVVDTLFAMGVKKPWEYLALVDDDKHRENPSVHRKSPWLMFGKRKMRDVAAAKDFAELSKNVMIVGPFGPIAKIFGIDPDTHVLYMFKEEAERDKFYEGVAAGKVTPPIFQMYRPGIFGLGTIDLFLKKKETKKMVAAVQCFVDTDGDKKTLVVTHMVVKPTYRREHINTFLVDYLVHQTGATAIEFDDLTDKGREFMLRYRSDQLGRGKERARFGR
jgi:hypothetical protein